MKRSLLSLAAAAGLLLPATAMTDPSLEITYTGTLSVAPSSVDLAGLDGGQFTWTGSFPAYATRSFTNDVNLDRFTGEISLTITGSAFADGTYTPSAGLETIGEVDSTTDQLQLSNAASFQINGAQVSVGTLLMAPGFDNGAPRDSNLLDPVQTVHVSSFTNWGAFVSTPAFETASYAVSDAAISTELPAAMVEVIYRGVLKPFGSLDLLGLAGTSFELRGLFDADSAPVASDPEALVDLFEGLVTLSLSGSPGLDGVHASSTHRVGEEAATDVSSRLYLEGGTFAVGDLAFEPPNPSVGHDTHPDEPANWLSGFRAGDLPPVSLPWSIHEQDGGTVPYLDDNTSGYARYVASPWHEREGALAGLLGEPRLTGVGFLSAGSDNVVMLDNAAPGATMGLFLSFASAPVPFKGGTLWAFPYVSLTMLTTTAEGRLRVPFEMPAAVPAGTELWVQVAIADTAALQGVALSNALQGITP